MSISFLIYYLLASQITCMSIHVTMSIKCHTNRKPCSVSWADPERGQGIRTPPPLENHKNIGFLSNTGPDPLKNHNTTKPSFIFGPLIGMPAKRPLRVEFAWTVSPLLKKNKKKNLSKLDPLWQNFLDPRVCLVHFSVSQRWHSLIKMMYLDVL